MPPVRGGRAIPAASFFPWNEKDMEPTFVW